MVYLIKEDDIAELKLSVRATNCLRRAGIHTVGVLVDYPNDKLSEIRFIGSKILEEIQTVLDDITGVSEKYMLVDAEKKAEYNNSLNQEASCLTEYAYKDDCGLIEGDISIEKLNITLRTKNCLIRGGYTRFSQLIGLTPEKLMCIKNMGEKSVAEILDFVEQHKIAFSIQQNDETKISYLNELAEKLNQCWGGNTNMWLRDIMIIKNDFPQYEDDAFLLELYECEFARSSIKNYIVSALKNIEYGLDRVKLFEDVPSCFYNTIAIEAILMEMESSSLIKIENQVISIRYMSLNEFVENIKDERRREIVRLRMQGQSLQQIAEELQLTRERVRQLIAKSFRHHPVLQEDKYAYIFQNYYFSQEDFKLAFDEPIETYHYLETAYFVKNSSKKPVSEILSDILVPLPLRILAERVIYKNYVTIDNIRFKKQKSVIIQYFVRKYCKNLTEYESFQEQYNLWLDSLGLAYESLLCIDSRTYEGHLSASDYVLWNQGRCFRYYNISKYDYTELLSAINLERYENLELSSLKFFREFPELMKCYDIRDEYELHNLLKKIWPKEKDHVFFKKMPTIEVGVVDRSKQILDLLMKYAPISSEDFAAKYEEIYGIKAVTLICNNYLAPIDSYLHDGVYTVSLQKHSK